VNKIRIAGKATKSSSVEDVYDEIKKLKELLDMDAITQEQFDENRAKLLSRI
jgi:hypothetical protein